MGEDRKLFKTKLCVLYQKGHCRRHTCSFAHGQAELRRFSTSFVGRRDYRGGDLRDKLERRRSPLRRYSPRRDGRDRQASRGYSSGQSGEERSGDRKRPKMQHFDDQSDRLGNVKASDRTDDRTRSRKSMAHDPDTVLGEQLRLAHQEMDALNDHKYELQLYLKDRVQEVDSLTSKIREQEKQVLQEKEECKRITSKIKRFITAHKLHSSLKDELKRSYDQLQKMGDQLSLDVSWHGVNEDDSNTNIPSDGETTANLMMGRSDKETIRTEKHSRRSVQHAKFDLNEVADQRDNGSAYHRILLSRPKLNSALCSAPSDNKSERHEPGSSLPLTSMAAHANDEGIETADMADEDLQVNETTSKRFEGATKVDALEDDAADVDVV